MAENKLRLPEINWPRVGDYLLGRSTLIGIASLMLLMISGYATWHGMRDFIFGVSSTHSSSTHSQESQDGLSVSHDLLFRGLHRLDQRPGIRRGERVKQMLVDLEVEHHVHAFALVTEVFHVGVGEHVGFGQNDAVALAPLTPLLGHCHWPIGLLSPR